MSFISIDGGGEERILACLPRVSAPGSEPFAPHYEEKFKVTPRGQWRPMTTDQAILRVDGEDLRVLNQGSTSGCAGFAATGAVEKSMEDAGLPFTALAAGRLYNLSGGGRDNGSMLGANLKYAISDGVPEMVSREQELDWRSRWTEAERDSALDFMIVRALDCPTFDHLVSASERGWCVEHGIFCGRNFGVDETGIWCVRPTGDRGGHALFSPSNALVRDGGQYGLLTKNSWSAKWGYKGWCVIPEEYFERSVFTDGWAVTAVKFPVDGPLIG